MSDEAFEARKRARDRLMTHSDACTCQACEYGLWCEDGERGQFVKGEDACKRCGVIAWKHSRRRP